MSTKGDTQTSLASILDTIINEADAKQQAVKKEHDNREQKRVSPAREQFAAKLFPFAMQPLLVGYFKPNEHKNSGNTSFTWADVQRTIADKMASQSPNIRRFIQNQCKITEKNDNLALFATEKEAAEYYIIKGLLQYYLTDLAYVTPSPEHLVDGLIKLCGMQILSSDKAKKIALDIIAVVNHNIKIMKNHASLTPQEMKLAHEKSALENTVYKAVGNVLYTQLTLNLLDKIRAVHQTPRASTITDRDIKLVEAFGALTHLPGQLNPYQVVTFFSIYQADIPNAGALLDQAILQAHRTVHSLNLPQPILSGLALEPSVTRQKGGVAAGSGQQAGKTMSRWINPHAAEKSPTTQQDSALDDMMPRQFFSIKNVF